MVIAGSWLIAWVCSELTTHKLIRQLPGVGQELAQTQAGLSETRERERRSEPP